MTRSQSSRIIFLFTMACITRSERNTKSSVQRKRRMKIIMCWHWQLLQRNWTGKEWTGQRCISQPDFLLPGLLHRKKISRNIFYRMNVWILHSAIKNIMWSLQELIFTHRDLQQLFTVYRISKESTCLWILETGLWTSCISIIPVH